MKKPELKEIELLWEDRKRHIGMPISFTKYKLSKDRLFVEAGLLNLKEEEVLLYRIKDITMERTLFQRILGVGSIKVYSNDSTSSYLEIKNIKYPKEVKELIHENVEIQKKERMMRATEIVDGFVDADGNGIDDRFE